MKTVDRVNKLVEDISTFKNQISEDHIKSTQIVQKCEKDCKELGSRYQNLNTKSSENHKDTIRRLVNLETSMNEAQNGIALQKLDMGKFQKILSQNSLSIKDNKWTIEKSIQDFKQTLLDHQATAEKEYNYLHKEISTLSDPVRQALEKNQRESDGIMKEFKNVQKQSRQVFSEFDKCKNQLIDAVDRIKNEGANQNSFKNTVSMINLDTKILMHEQPGLTSENNHEFTRNLQNAPMSPVTYARTTTAQTANSHFPILRSKKGYITSRDLSRNENFNIAEADFRSLDGAIKEEDEKTGKSKRPKNSNKKNLFLKSRLNKKPIRYNEELRRSKSAIKHKGTFRNINLC